MIAHVTGEVNFESAGWSSSTKQATEFALLIQSRDEVYKLSPLVNLLRC